MRREPLLAGLLCLAGAFVVLVGTGRAWAEVEVAAGALAPARTIAVRGSDLVPGLQALGLVGLAGVVALAATRRWGRHVVGALLMLAGLGVLSAALGVDVRAGALRVDGVPADADVGRTAWPLVTGLGGLLLTVAGLLVTARGRRWAALDRRYDAPAAAPPQVPDVGPVAERDLWEALDRGDDPTAAGPSHPEGTGAAPRG